MSEDDFNIYDEFPMLIEDLKSNDLLPALVFMNYRYGTEMLAESLMQHVDKKIKKSSKIKSLQEKYESLGGGINQLSRFTKTKSKDERDGTVHVSEENLDLLNNLTLEIDTEIQKLAFSSKIPVTQKIKQKIVDKMVTKDKVEDKMVQKQIKYGIGFHHAGRNQKHRRAVEMLYRSRNIQVVTATATLSLGINMPCRTVVFAGDDQYLDALSYRQMSGI